MEKTLGIVLSKYYLDELNFLFEFILRILPLLIKHEGQICPFAKKNSSSIEK